MEGKSISVIMPVYNQASFICRALRSIQSQSHKNWELIVIDDGSTDEIISYLKPFMEDKRIRLLQNTSNKGLGFSLNKGLDNAQNEIIAYLPPMISTIEISRILT